MALQPCRLPRRPLCASVVRLFGAWGGDCIALFPDWRTGWHFDDKVGQKYLFEAIGAAAVNTCVFYSEADALEWIRRTQFPKVFKLRNGAGSSNVRLVETRRAAERLVRQAFSRGFAAGSRSGQLFERIRLYRLGKCGIREVAKGLVRFFLPTDFVKLHPREKGYVYFQDFIAGNDYDTRVVVTGDKAFAIKRLTRKGDFRASGSGSILYDKAEIDQRMVRMAFDANRKLRLQSAAFDFILSGGEPLIVEVSFGYSQRGYDACPGYWDENMAWHSGPFNPQQWQVEDLIARIERNNRK